MAPHTSAHSLHDELLARSQQEGAPMALRKALVLHATSAPVAKELLGQGALKQVFQSVRNDTDLLEMFSRQCASLLQSMPEAANDCPDDADLTAAETQMAASAGGNA